MSKEGEPKTIRDLLPGGEDEKEDLELLAQLAGEDGKLKVDLSMPENFQIDIMASQMVEHLVSYEQTRQAWKSARGSGQHKRAEDLFAQMNFNQLTIAIIQAKYPKAKGLADEMMKVRAKQAELQRQALLKG